MDVFLLSSAFHVILFFTAVIFISGSIVYILSYTFHYRIHSRAEWLILIALVTIMLLTIIIAFVPNLLPIGLVN